MRFVQSVLEPLLGMPSVHQQHAVDETLKVTHRLLACCCGRVCGQWVIQPFNYLKLNFEILIQILFFNFLYKIYKFI